MWWPELCPAGPLDIAVIGDTVAAEKLPVSAPLLFTADDCLDIGTCPGSPVSLDYRERTCVRAARVD